MIFIKY